MRKALFCGAAIAAMSVAVSASAADLYSEPAVAYAAPLAPTFDWTGFYAGVHGGYAWGEWDGDLIYEPDPLALFNPTDYELDGDGWNAGAQVGANYQIGKWVLGVEADISWSDLSGSEEFVSDQPLGAPDGVPDYGWEVEHKLETFGTARVRIGSAVTDRWLVYATGGLGWGKTDSNIVIRGYEGQNFPGPTVTARGSNEEDHIGWSAGIGSEYRLTDNISLKAEWLYVDLGDADYDFSGTLPGGAPYNTDSAPADLTFHTFRVGLNFLLN